MKNKAIFAFIIIVLGILEVTVADLFKVFRVRPDFFLISVLIGSLIFELRWAIFFAIFAGFLKDALGINPFGINTLLFPAWAFLIIKLSKKITIENDLIRCALMFIIVICNDISARLISAPLANFAPIGVFSLIVFIEALYTAVILPLLFRLSKII